MLFDIRWPLSQQAHSEWQLQALTIWLAFRKSYPDLRPVTGDELVSLAPELQREFTQPELCLCGHHQFPTMKGIALRLEHQMDKAELSVAEGNQLIKNMVLIIEGLDRFGTATKPQPDKAAHLSQSADMSLGPGAGEGGESEKTGS